MPLRLNGKQLRELIDDIEANGGDASALRRELEEMEPEVRAPRRGTRFRDEEEETMEERLTRRVGDIFPGTIPFDKIVDYDYRFTLKELREQAREAGLSLSGDKKELAAKLIANGAMQSHIRTAFRAGEVRPTTGIMATEGYGLYITPRREYAEALAKRFRVKEVKEVQHMEPRNPLVLQSTDELPSISYEAMRKAQREWLFSPVKADDTPWVRLHKQAAKDVGLLPGAPPTVGFNERLDTLIRQADYDAVVVPEFGLARPGIGFIVLLDESLYLFEE